MYPTVFANSKMKQANCYDYPSMQTVIDLTASTNQLYSRKSINKTDIDRMKLKQLKIFNMELVIARLKRLKDSKLIESLNDNSTKSNMETSTQTDRSEFQNNYEVFLKNYLTFTNSNKDGARIDSDIEIPRQYYADTKSVNLPECVCPYCGRKYKLLVNLKMHVVRAHTIEHRCFDCSKVFDSHKALSGHRRNLHTGIEHECRVCSKTFKSKPYLMKHISQRHPPDTQKFECDVCGAVLNSKQTLKGHIRNIHPNEDAFKQCPNCLKTFKNHHYMQCHRRRCGLKRKRYSV